MKKRNAIAIAALLLTLAACAPSPREKAFKLFNDAVSLSLDAADAAARGDSTAWEQLTDSAILKYKAALLTDSTYPGARGALGNSYYQLKNYGEAVNWLQQANKYDGDVAEVYREIGLCKINQGELQAGRQSLNKAFRLDSSQTIKAITTDDLLDIGLLAFHYGTHYKDNGDTIAAQDYRLFSIGVLLTAFNIDSTRRDVADSIASFARQLGDMETARQFQQ